MEMQNNLENALETFMKKYQCSEETADRYFREAKCLHSRKSLYITGEEGDESRDVMEEVADEEDSDMLEIFWNGIHANAVRTAFDRLTPNEKEYLQRRKRNTALSKEIEQLRESETDLLRQKSDGNQRKRAAAELIPTTQHILDSYDALTVEEKNGLWKLVMRRATIYREPEGEVRIQIFPNLPR